MNYLLALVYYVKPWLTFQRSHHHRHVFRLYLHVYTITCLNGKGYFMLTPHH
ncbi:hypothetical protein VP409E501_P0068 [Vibrio phage 409E50-1]|nr:hypothetical protein VP521E561_P0068 [Vibrio phage 521E56-1]CAH9012981.1 hypothetical protein VP384E501_P0068 [Vibrio phage 384E50-1]CAH9013016.1 hypothetical protein VP409E501_P0068 [Vibrio phage 409E50-1]CAH9013066.1 hypothetical protein VP402E501_P0068 [Vibrio phage 402E50-1]CAH9013798.1 hypothetical protein VP405E501_P0068 [Vibrio phage 405E50-1]CAH9013850.1 hypothetical protein VP413E501_P0068 [Vibrio phage 413E50-1]